MLGDPGSLSLLLRAQKLEMFATIPQPSILLSATVYYCLLLHQGQMTSQDTLTSTIYDTLLPH